MSGATEFNIGPYRFLFGPSRIEDNPRLPLRDGFTLWMWNGQYWHIEIKDCSDIEGARNTMQFIIADRKASHDRS